MTLLAKPVSVMTCRKTWFTGGGGDMTLRFLSREQILSFRPGCLVVLAQQSQEALSQHDIAIFFTFSRTDMNAQSLTVNIGEAQSAYFRNPETGGIGGGNDGFILNRADYHKNPEYFFRAENDREGLGPFGMGNILDDLRSFQGNGVVLGPAFFSFRTERRITGSDTLIRSGEVTW